MAMRSSLEHSLLTEALTRQLCQINLTTTGYQCAFTEIQQKMKTMPCAVAQEPQLLQKLRLNDLKFKGILGYKLSSKPVWAA